MLKFKDYQYVRPNLEEFVKAIELEKAKLTDEHDLETQYQAYLNISNIFDELASMITISSIRNSIDTKDEFYEAEKEFFNQEMPKLRPLSQGIAIQLLGLKNRPQLEEKLGSLMFKQTELSLKTFKPEIIPDLQKENKLSTEYSKLIGSAQIEFDGGIYNLSQMAPFTQNIDRDIRRKAALAVSGFFKENEAEIDRIYDELVKLRHNMAIQLGYENYVQLGYDRMGRTDYDHLMVKNYRDQIYEDLVPIVNQLRKRQADRLGIKEPKHYDFALSFLSGNPTPIGGRDYLVQEAKTMYEEMSPETGEFFNFMIDHELMDLETKQGKRGGGYCTFIPKYNSPFIFSNFNGTAGDVDVLTHEAGHAFQVYSSRNLPSDSRWPTMEAAEIHSMSMEFFAWPWVEKFFGKEADKYRFDHLAGALQFLPYGVAVDEFQHFVYENPNITPDERKAAWRRIELKYLPYRDFGEDEFMAKGTYWFRQGHIFSSPFYYIDYTLAQVVAFQFWVLDQVDHQKAWDKYYKLCTLGGSKSFLELLEAAKLEVPFETGTVKKIIVPIKEYLDSVDDKKL